MRWALTGARLSTRRAWCVPPPRDCDDGQLAELGRSVQLAFCSTMGLYLLDQCNLFTDVAPAAERRSAPAPRARPATAGCRVASLLGCYDDTGPSSRKTRASLNAERTLNATPQPRFTLSLR